MRYILTLLIPLFTTYRYLPLSKFHFGGASIHVLDGCFHVCSAGRFDASISVSDAFRDFWIHYPLHVDKRGHANEPTSCRSSRPLVILAANHEPFRFLSIAHEAIVCPHREHQIAI